MKKLIICVLSLFLLMFSSHVEAEDVGSLEWSIPEINVTFLEETVNVLDGILEMQSSIQEPVYFEVPFEGHGVPPVFDVLQMKEDEVKEIGTFEESSFSFSADLLTPGWPVYLRIADGRDEEVIGVVPLGIRVRKNAFLSKVPDDLGADFGKGLSLNMDYLLPGMELDVLPFLIPVTYKTYADGTFRAGIGYNSTDEDFWIKAGSGEMPEGKLAEDLKALFDDSHALDTKGKPQSMGVVVLFNGWAEGNVNSTEPVLGQMQLYIGTGFSIDAQYGIFTFNLSLSGGATGKFDFHYEYSPEDSEFHFNSDSVLAGLKGALEAYGGIGCSLASIGVYGAGSIEYQQEMYPDPDVEHLIVAGELGLKAKLFGKVLACLKIVAGSHDLAEDFKANITTLGAEMTSEEFKDYLLANDYGNTKGVLLKGGESMKWHGADVEVPDVTNDWERETDFSHMLAEDVYPDSHVQIVNTGSSALPEMTMVFLGADQSRKQGNSSVLQTGYYNIATQFISEPIKLHDDGTADFEPYLYENNNGNAYLVWKNAVEEINGDMTFSDIASRTDIYFSEHGTANSWRNQERITNYAGSDIFAAGAKVCADENGSPAVFWYTNDVNDPAGLAGTHEVYIARKNSSGKWEAQKTAQAEGNMMQLDCEYFGYDLTAAISYESEGTRRVELYRDGKKIFEKENASNGRFVKAGNNIVYFTWFENGRIYRADTGLNTEPLTPEDIIIPQDAYDIYGNIGANAIMITSVSTKDTHGDAFAWISYDGGINWARSDLTKISAGAYVSHLSAAFTDEREPIILYSIQNYETNADLSDEALLAKENSGMQVLLGQEDDRFTDTRTDLYISARAANSHIRFESGKALDTDTLLPGKPVKFSLKIRNTGLYNIRHADILCNGEKVGEYNGNLGLWETADVTAETMIPDNPQEILSYTFEISSREDGLSDSRISVEVDPGYLEAKMWHSYRHGTEQIRYQIVNHGYLRKNATMLVRDDANETVLDEWTVPYDAGEKRDSEYSAKSGLFVSDGAEDVTLYVLLDGEQPGDEGISLNRIKSVVPLEEIYGQPTDILFDRMTEGVQSKEHTARNIIIGSAVIAAAAAAVILYRRKKKGANSAQ